MQRKCYLVAAREIGNVDELVALVVDRDGAFMTTDKAVAQKKLESLQSSYPYVGELHELTILVN